MLPLRHSIAPLVSSPDPTAAPLSVIDRWCARLGARTLVTGRPGMGWLLTEVIPVFVWAQVTGALFGESFYLVTYLTLLGADAATLALLPLVAYAGNACSTALVVLRPVADPKRRCVIDTLWARVCWLGTIVGPLIGMAWGWPAWVQIGCVLLAIFSTHLLHLAGGSGFIVWTQAVVPPALRGSFWMWRNVASYGTVALVVLCMGMVLPKGATADAHHLPWLMGIFTVVTLLCIASSWMLARSPAMPAIATTRIFSPFHRAWQDSRGFGALISVGAVIAASIAITMAYVPTLLHQRGIGPGTFAAAQGTAFMPGMLLGIILSGWLLSRIGGRWLLVIGTGLLALGDGALLLLPDDGAAWIGLPLALSGLAKGLWSIAAIGRQQEISPAGDVRFPALITGVSALIGILCALLLRWGVPHFEQHLHAVVPSVLIGIATVLRLIACLIALVFDRTKKAA